MGYGQVRIPIGARRERVQVQRAVTVDDGMGGQTVTKWALVAEPWAAVQPLDERDKESLKAQQITASHAYHVVIPYRTGITPKMRVVYRGKPLEIHTVVDDEQRSRRLFLQVGEVQSS